MSVEGLTYFFFFKITTMFMSESAQQCLACNSAHQIVVDCLTETKNEVFEASNQKCPQNSSLQCDSRI